MRWYCLLGLLLLPDLCVADPSILFNRDIRPLLSDRCFHCHGPNEHDRQAGLRLDQADGPEGAVDGAEAIAPGDPDESEVWHRINSEDDDAMPPPDSSKKVLTAGEKQLIKRWIEEGAAYDDFWAFVPPHKPALPTIDNDKWNQHEIDRLVMQQLQAEDLARVPPLTNGLFCGGSVSILPGCHRLAKRSKCFLRTPTMEHTSVWLIACWRTRRTVNTWPSTG